MLVLKNICKEFNNTKVLNELNIEFNSGLNFIVGPSGSGKSTLLKIISGIDKNYEGQVYYKGNSVKEFNKEELNSYYYNSVGFIWQDFKLINHLSVEDNVKIALELTDFSSDEKDKKVKEILKRLAIGNLAKKGVEKLSGGQKQRVAIARALVKDPEIIIADEPTGALDKNSSSIIINALRKIAKERLVIVVTHDKSLIDNESNSFLLDNGTITQVSSGAKVRKEVNKKIINNPKLSLISAMSLGFKNYKGMFMKFIMTSLILVLSSYFLLLNFTGTAANEQEKILNDLIQAKGDGIKDISLYSSVTGASGADGNNNSKANLDIKQDVSKILNKYKDDERIEYIVALDSIRNMVISMDGVTDKYKVENTNNAPVLNKVIEGRLPNMEGNEVAVTKLFLERLNINPRDAIGKTISIEGTNYDLSGANPKEVPIKAKDLKIVGVIDSKASFEGPKGEKYDYEFEDSFIFGLDVVKSLKEQTNSSKENMSFTMRVKDIKDVMPIVEELTKEGITPLGEFESVRDILTINSTTKEQSGAITSIIAVVALLITLATVAINAVLRNREFAILKINGYSIRSIFNINLVEYILITISSIIMFIMISPLINKFAIKFMSMSTAGISSIIYGSIIILVQGLVMGIISGIISSNIKLEKNIMIGDR